MKYTLNIGWLYPELMSTYGDRGNIIVLEKRCIWRDIKVRITPIDFSTTVEKLESVDLIFGGGAQDRQQSILIDDLRSKKGPELKKMMDRGIPGLFVCGSPQLLGQYFINGNGEKIEGLGIFDMVSRYPGKDVPRCIGNLVAKITDSGMQTKNGKNTIVGFENHGGRTYLGKNIRPFATVLYGNGNNGEDKTEGAIYHNCIATYSHGPFLPKNPHIADWLIKKALSIKYRKEIPLSPLDDSLEWQAHMYVLKRFHAIHP